MNTQNIQSKTIIIPVFKNNWTNVKSLFFKDLDLTFFQAKEGETQVIEAQSKQYFLLGLEEANDLSKIKTIAKKFSWQFKDKFNAKGNAIYFSDAFSANQIEAFWLGMHLGSYQIKKKKQEDQKHPFTPNLHNVEVVANTTINTQTIHNKVNTIAEAQFVAMDWLNKSPNHKTSNQIASYIQNLSEELKDFGVSSKIFNKKECQDLGLHAFLAVNQGSAYEPAFCILEYKGKNAKKKVGLIGKCVTFDTGGISIKASQNMHYMKSDMGGATAVLGAFIAAVKLELPVHLVAILPATDNAVNNNAYLPGDVIESYSGKTIEVLNTDAEGRMTLADAIHYMVKNYAPDLMLDLATLTGSAVRTFGYYGAALLTENVELEQTIRQAGEKVGEKSWPLPLWDEYLENLKSDVADIRHMASHAMSDVINAAKFLQQFTENHKNWAHLDIAGVAYGNNDYSTDKSATGYGVQLILEILQRYVQ